MYAFGIIFQTERTINMSVYTRNGRTKYEQHIMLSKRV